MPEASRERPLGGVTVDLVSTGHQALDHRLFDKEARSLAAAGADVRIVADHPRHELRDGIELVPLAPKGGRLARFLLSPWRALRIVRSRRAAVVHLHDAELLQIGPALRLLGHPITIYDVHEDFANLMLRREWIPPRLRPLVRAGLVAGEAVLARSVDGVVAATATLAEHFQRHPRTYVYNFPSRAFVAANASGITPPSERGFDVVHLGVLSSERMEFLAAVFEALLSRRADARLRVVGATPNQVEWLSAHFPPTTADVRGKVPYAEVGPLVRDCRVGINVHPVIYPHLRVAVPVKVLEYMGAGCGVVTSWLPELDALLREETKEHMTVLRDVAADRYADALAVWLGDSERLDQSGAFLRASALDLYSWESEVGKLVELYGRLLARREAR